MMRARSSSPKRSPKSSPKVSGKAEVIPPTVSTLPPRKGCLKKEGDNGGGLGASVSMKKVFFDEIIIKEYPTILGDHPAVYVLEREGIVFLDVSFSFITNLFYDFRGNKDSQFSFFFQSMV